MRWLKTHLACIYPLSLQSSWNFVVTWWNSAWSKFICQHSGHRSSCFRNHRSEVQGEDPTGTKHTPHVPSLNVSAGVRVRAWSPGSTKKSGIQPPALTRPVKLTNDIGKQREEQVRSRNSQVQPRDLDIRFKQRAKGAS